MGLVSMSTSYSASQISLTIMHDIIECKFAILALTHRVQPNDRLLLHHAALSLPSRLKKSLVGTELMAMYWPLLPFYGWMHRLLSHVISDTRWIRAHQVRSVYQHLGVDASSFGDSMQYTIAPLNCTPWCATKHARHPQAKSTHYVRFLRFHYYYFHSSAKRKRYDSCPKLVQTGITYLFT